MEEQLDADHFLTIDTGSSVFRAQKDEAKIGRAPSNDLIISSAAVSSSHCVINRINGEVFVTDLSTNGTALDGVKLKKGERAQVTKDSVELELAPGKAKAVKLTLAMPLKSALKRAKTEVQGTLADDDDEAAGAAAEADNKKKKEPDNDDSAIRESLTCSICQSVFHYPVSLIPCMHTFCGGCYGPWQAKSSDCPACRVKVDSFQVHHLTMSAADAYLAKNASEKRDATELAELDTAFERIKPMMGEHMKKKQHAHWDAGSDSSGEYDSDDDGGGGGGGGFFGFAAAMPAPWAGGFGWGGGGGGGGGGNQCRDCVAPNANDGFQCPPVNAAHAPCSYCHAPMPARNLESTKCFGCARLCCGRYWPASACAPFLRPLREREMGFHPTLLLDNAHETQILQTHLLAKQIPTHTFVKDVLVAKFAAGELSLPTHPGATADSLFCPQCFKKVASSLAYEYRAAIPKDDLPADVTSRHDCHWGRNCRTAPHNASHAGRYNHICAQTRQN